VAECPSCNQTVEAVVITEDKGIEHEVVMGPLAEKAAAAAYEFFMSREHDWYNDEQRLKARERTLLAFKAWLNAK